MIEFLQAEVNQRFMLTLIVIVLFVTMGLLEVVRSRVLVKFGNRFANILSNRILKALLSWQIKK